MQAVVNIAAARNMTTTAEGVETEQQLDMLRTLGCTEMQGYLFSAAKPAAGIEEMFRSRGARNWSPWPKPPVPPLRRPRDELLSRQRYQRTRMRQAGRNFLGRHPCASQN